MNVLQSTIHCTQSDVMHEDKSFYINEEIHGIISITVSDNMLLILFRFLLLSLTAEAFNVTLFKSHVFNYYNYIRWVHNAPPLVEDKALENGAYYWAYYLSTYPSPQCLHHNQAGGQNIYFTWHPQEISEYDLARATIQAFYSEKRYYDYSRPNFNHAASHFTNLIWKSTQRIGIAVYWKTFYDQHGGCHMQAWPSRPLLGQMVVINEWPRGNTMTPWEFNKNVLPPKQVFDI